MKDATGVMEPNLNTRRRRLSSFSSTTTSAEHNVDIFPRLMSSEENGDSVFHSSANELRHHGDGSRWLRPLGLIFGIIFIATIFFNSATKLSWVPVKTSFLTSSKTSGSIESQEAILGIELHPEDHMSRQPTTITHHWNITSGIRYPDGVKKAVYLVNELFPGPTIECRPGDRLVFHVTNTLASEGVSIHWHGLEMRGANQMDGAVGITQCPVSPGETFIYDSVVGNENVGTFWWHAHSQVQRGDGMYGGLVVHKPAEGGGDMKEHKYKRDILVMVGDWYHRGAEEVLAWYTSARGFGNEVSALGSGFLISSIFIG